MYDVLVIGSGPGGYVAAIRAAQLGMKVACVERESLGGICLNWGCIPTKALLKSAEVLDYLQHADKYGLKASGIDKDFGAVVSRSRDVANGMSKGISFLFRKNKIETIEGVARLTKDKKVEVTAKDGSKKTYEAKHILLATGARARSLPTMPIDGKKIIGYREAMVLPQQPKKMIVVGSGAIGMEFGYFYHTMGTEVTIVEYMDRILPVEDEEVSKAMERIYKGKGMNIMTSSEVIATDTSGNGVVATVKTAKGEVKLEADILLSAVGIVANIENLGLEELGIKTDKRERLRIILKDIASLLEHTAFNFERLEYLQDTFMGLVNLEQNRIIKLFTVVTIFFLPPTLIAGMFGMNFKEVPFDEHPLGFVFTSVCMFVPSLLLLYYFRRKKLIGTSDFRV